MQTIARGIAYIDLLFLGNQRVIATAVLQGPAGVALVDPGPSTCLETLRGSLSERGIALGDVQALLLTHIHLDHAGVTGTLVRENPDIQVYVHEKGAPHLVDPTRLLNSANRLYGDEMDRLWGDFLPVPRENLRVLCGGERIALADRNFHVAYTPGHASHHVSFFDSSSGVAFVGDTAGVRTGAELFAMPPTPPPDIDLETWKASVALIDKWQPETLFLTHFGPYSEAAAHLASLVEHLDSMAALAKLIAQQEVTDDERIIRFVDEARRYLGQHVSSTAAASYEQAAPLSQCWLGLARYWRKRGVGEGGS